MVVIFLGIKSGITCKKKEMGRNGWRGVWRDIFTGRILIARFFKIKKKKKKKKSHFSAAFVLSYFCSCSSC
jgi:hypothetical protein